jgi:hypothetical protein
MIEPEARVVVYCAAESHPGSRFEWEFARFTHPEVGRIWLERTRYPRASRRNPNAPTSVVLKDDQPLAQDEMPTPADQTRHRYDFKCKWCDERQVFRGENLDPVFDRIVASGSLEVSPGLSEVSLSGLAAIISN